jgi:hypothetical protein
MKKLSLIILLCGLLMLMTSCSPADAEKPVDADGAAGTDETAETSAAEAQDTSSPAEKLTMSVKEGSISPSGATVVFTNDSNVEFATGTYYLLEKFDGNNWEKANTIIEEYAWELVAFILPPGQDTERVEEWEWLYGKLSPGRYRINKEFMYLRSPGDYDEYPISVEFEIV